MRNVIFAIVFLAPPWLKKVILRWFCGAKFGRKANIGWFSSVIGSYVEMGHFSTIKPLTLIRCDGAVAIGSYTEVSSFSLLYGCANLHIGDRCYIGPQSLINVSEDVTIGNGVGMGARTIIFTHGSFLPYTDGYWANFGKVTIGNNVWIATGVFVHPGVTIEDSVFVNSRSVISGTVPFGSVMEGFPAKEVSRLDKIRRPVTPEKRDALIQNMLTHFVSFLKKARPNFEVYDHRARSVLIRSGKRATWWRCLVLMENFQLTLRLPGISESSF